MDPFAVTARGPGGQRSVATARHCALVTTATTTATGWTPLTVQPGTVQWFNVDGANAPALLHLAWVVIQRVAREELRKARAAGFCGFCFARAERPGAQLTHENRLQGGARRRSETASASCRR